MTVELKYGDSGTLQIDVPVDSILVDFPPRGVPLDDPVRRRRSGVGTA